MTARQRWDGNLEQIDISAKYFCLKHLVDIDVNQVHWDKNLGYAHYVLSGESWRLCRQVMKKPNKGAR